MKSSDDDPQELFNAPDDKLFNDGWVAMLQNGNGKIWLCQK